MLAAWPADTVLACALMLLNRSVASFPEIELVDGRPGYVSAAAEAYVVDGVGRIYVITTATAFVDARRAVYRCGNLQALRKVASTLIHEEWHVRHGPDEAGAYTAQLSALVYLGAGPGTPLYTEVRRSMQAVLRRRPN
jgi:hypothetical protein